MVVRCRISEIFHAIPVTVCVDLSIGKASDRDKVEEVENEEKTRKVTNP